MRQHLRKAPQNRRSLKDCTCPIAHAPPRFPSKPNTSVYEQPADAKPKEAFAYHAAGFAGSGGSSYIDSVIMREKDANTAWMNASDGTLEERVYYVQNWRSDVMAILDSDGRPLERVRYTAFGTPSAHPIADVDGNGVVEAADVTKFLAFAAGGANATVFTETDLNADGLFPDDADIEFFDDEYVRVGANSVFGMNKLSGLGNREGFGGHEWDICATVWHLKRTVFDGQSGTTAPKTLQHLMGLSALAIEADLAPIESEVWRRSQVPLAVILPAPSAECEKKNEGVTTIVICGSENNAYGKPCGCISVAPGQCYKRGLLDRRMNPGDPTDGCDWDMYFDPWEDHWVKCNNLGICWPWNPEPGKERPLRDWGPVIEQTLIEACSTACADKARLENRFREGFLCGYWKLCMLRCLQSSVPKIPLPGDSVPRFVMPPCPL